MNEIALPEQNAEGISALEQARILVVEDAASCRKADEMAAALRELEKQVDALFDEHIKRAHEAHKALTSRKKAFVEPILEARGLLKNKMWAWQQEQERLRRAEEARLQEQARKLAEEQQLADAVLAEQAGDKEEAERIVAAPVQAPTVVVPKAVPKTKTVIRQVPDSAKIQAAVERGVKIPGVHAWQVWQFKVMDPKSLPEEYRRPA